MREATTPPEALLNSALRLLAARRRGVSELRGRLKKKGFGEKEVSDCLRWLEERELLDDRAFSRALVRDRLRFSPRSSTILRSELSRRGIAAPVAQEAIDTVLQEEGRSDTTLAEEAARGWARKQGLEILRELTAERFSQEREKARRRLYGFLGRRGFRGEAARAGMDAGLTEASKILGTKD